MKTIHLLLLTGACFLFLRPVLAQDTITIELGQKAKVLIYTQNREALMRVRGLDLNRIVWEATKGLDSLVGAEAQKKRVYEYEFNLETKRLEKIAASTDSLPLRTPKGQPRHDRFWAVDLGLNNSSRMGSSPEANGQPYALRLGSARYIAFGVYERLRLGGKKSPFSFQAGLEFSWYNFMFEGNNYLVQEEDGVAFRDYLVDFGQTLRRSKLVLPYFNLPITFNARLRDREGRRTFNFGLGTYAGLRIGGYTKIREEGKPERTRENFFSIVGATGWKRNWATVAFCSFSNMT
ncbi:MAG: hypothetical protein HC913_20145 [Microscillaceae bacterium]|nr:hypothetical protein [Microscillaceae bacterium]